MKTNNDKTIVETEVVVETKVIEETEVEEVVVEVVKDIQEEAAEEADHRFYSLDMLIDINTTLYKAFLLIANPCLFFHCFLHWCIERCVWLVSSSRD
jgi:hypothetical protein